ncbi:MAG: UDP-glucose/GDP-mannose dehydrogenase family protein [Bacteroidota bacterium]|nr:UDP-glucose/GDP-mannose dehydrogenase family protein [Bacteroidota bacterium]MDP4226217.1 UDP-glucose/GDP-mannose dehydrogenase family protein [Bacteroidota bacterium]MDP4272714.1 UDP-glucose/GDP-mannose dehydrogenase family protein [Bacteroidota bacterium]
MKISIVGTGYVGLVSGTCFAETGIDVTCVDIDKGKIEKLHQGIVPIYEPGLDTMIKRNVEKGRLSFTTNLGESLVGAEAVFIAVGTPPDEDGSADLKYVLGVAREIGQNLDHYLVVVTKSTVPIGTAQKVKAAVQAELTKRKMNVPFDVASNPEFLKEGNAIDDFLKPDRIVIGVESDTAQKTLSKLYKPFLLNGHPLLFMDIPSAEMTKYTANSMLATKISFMNEIANLCELLGADVNMVRLGIGSDARIGNKFIYPGAGYGGSCFPKDVKALINTAKKNNFTLNILQAVENVNEKQKVIIFDKIVSHYGKNLAGKKFALWGLSFKPQTDDMREAPSLSIIDKLTRAGASVKAYDPVAMDECKRRIGSKIEYAIDPYDALIDADGLIVITEWPEFRVPNLKVMERLLKSKVIFDGRNIYDSAELLESGFSYYSIGRRPSLTAKN